MVGFIDNVRSLSPCMVCGSSVIKENDLHIDWIHGDWKGEWTCENGHKNINMLASRAWSFLQSGCQQKPFKSHKAWQS
jgi:hypothetical protein